jgi:hypothetical protein
LLESDECRFAAGAVMAERHLLQGRYQFRDVRPALAQRLEMTRIDTAP